MFFSSSKFLFVAYKVAKFCAEVYPSPNGANSVKVWKTLLSPPFFEPVFNSRLMKTCHTTCMYKTPRLQRDTAWPSFCAPVSSWFRQ